MSEEAVAYFFDSVIRARETNCREFVPRNIREALPNRRYTLPGKATFSYSDMAVIGTITAVEKGAAFAHVGEDLLEPVYFDDPSAAERTVDVHVAVKEFFGKEPTPSTLVFEMGLLNADDPALFIDGLRSLGRIATALTIRRRTGVLIPAEQGALIGRVDGRGVLTFSALALEGEQFVAGITTVDAFRAAAREPVRITVLPGDRMTLVWRRLTACETRALDSDGALGATLLDDASGAGRTSGRVLDVDQAWEGVRFLLTAGGSSQGSLALACAGGQPVGPDLGFGHGPARMLHPRDVQAVAQTWADTPEDAFRERFDPVAMHRLHVYPRFWEQPHVLDEYLMPRLRSLHAFYQSAATRNEAVIMGLL